MIPLEYEARLGREQVAGPRRRLRPPETDGRTANAAARR